MNTVKINETVYDPGLEIQRVVAHRRSPKNKTISPNDASLCPKWPLESNYLHKEHFKSKLKLYIKSAEYYSLVIFQG